MDRSVSLAGVRRGVLAGALTLSTVLVVGGVLPATALAAPALPPECSGSGVAGSTVTCTYGPGTHTFTPPAGVSSLTVRLVGAAGGAGANGVGSGPGGSGGPGAVVTGTVAAGALQVRVGSRGADAPVASRDLRVESAPGAGGAQGYGPGGSGGNGVADGGGGGGGGGSAVLTATGTPAAVAGGGGGGGGTGPDDPTITPGSGGAGDERGGNGASRGRVSGAGGAAGAASGPAGADGTRNPPTDDGTYYVGGGGGGGGLRGGAAGGSFEGFAAGGGGGGSNLVPTGGTQAGAVPGSEGPDGSVTITYTRPAPPATSGVRVSGAAQFRADGQTISLSLDATSSNSTTGTGASGRCTVSGGGYVARCVSITGVTRGTGSEANTATVTGTAQVPGQSRPVGFRAVVTDRANPDGAGRDTVTLTVNGRSATGTVTNGNLTIATT